MSVEKTRTKNRKKLFKLRKNRSWIAIVLFVCIGALMAFIIYDLIFSTAGLALNSKLTTEYNSIKLVAEIYDSSSDDYNVLQTSGYDYILAKSDGTVIKSSGENTMSPVGGEVKRIVLGNVVTFDNGFKDVEFYEDTASGIILVKSDGDITLDKKKFEKEFFDSVTRLDEETKDLDEEELEQYGNEINNNDEALFLMPVWMRFKLKNGDLLSLKANITIRVSEFAFVVLLALVLAILVLLLMVVMIISIISGIVRQRRMGKMFFTDIPTKGHNHTWFLFRGEHILNSRRWSKQQFALVDIMLVKYRRFCACHSIEEGDQVVTAVNRLISSELKGKELSAHSTEDSFALLLRCDDESMLRERLSALIARLTESTAPNCFTYHVGVQLIPPSESSGLFRKRRSIDIESEFNYACTACATLDESDESGIVFFEGRLVEEQRWIDTVTASQQTALANEEFVVYYQPKYDPRTNELRGAEALIRWQSPVHGFVTPYRFIPIFEKNGFITEIDHYMIAHVARDQRRWLDMGYRCVPVSVNVSRAHFIESDLAEQIRDMVDKENTPHELIEIELTESAFFDDKNAMINTIAKLKSYGFAVSMDDFGSGYSSLNSLKDMPLDVLKLDAEFFRGEAAGTDRGEIVVSEAIKLAKNLNMRTVAEGVEIKDQVDFLASQGCDMIQGYYFAKPMPGAEYEERMKNVTAPGSDEA